MVSEGFGVESEGWMTEGEMEGATWCSILIYLHAPSQDDFLLIPCLFGTLLDTAVIPSSSGICFIASAIHSFSSFISF